MVFRYLLLRSLLFIFFSNELWQIYYRDLVYEEDYKKRSRVYTPNLLIQIFNFFCSSLKCTNSQWDKLRRSNIPHSYFVLQFLIFYHFRFLSFSNSNVHRHRNYFFPPFSQQQCLAFWSQSPYNIVSLHSATSSLLYFFSGICINHSSFLFRS